MPRGSGEGSTGVLRMDQAVAETDRMSASAAG